MGLGRFSLRTASRVEVQVQCGFGLRAARRAWCVAQAGFRGAHGELGVAHTHGFGAVHADGGGAAGRTMGTVEPTEPFLGTRGVLMERLPERLSADPLGGGLVETRGNPDGGLPRVLQLLEVPEIPLPFDHGFGFRENADQTKGIHPREFPSGQECGDFGGRVRPECLPHEITAAEGVFGDLFRDGIPVQKGEGGPAIIDSHPGAATRLRGKEGLTISESVKGGRMGGDTGPLFVPIHPKDVPVATGDEGGGTHAL